MMENIENNVQAGGAERPQFLTVLCILTFISAGIGSVSALITPSFSSVMVDFVNLSPSLDEDMKTELITVFQAGWGYYFTTFLLSACSLAGAILMWNLKKNGFHFYALGNLGLLFVPMLYLGMQTTMGGVLFTAGFIGMYAIHLKIMK